MGDALVKGGNGSGSWRNLDSWINRAVSTESEKDWRFPARIEQALGSGLASSWAKHDLS